jgi:hypothetical protein
MTNSLLERLYGGLWGGAIGWAMETPDLATVEPGFELGFEPRFEPSIAPSVLWVQQSLLWNERVELDRDWAEVLGIVLEAEHRSSGDWTVAMPWAMNRSKHRAVTGLWLGTQLGVTGGSRAIPVSLRVKYEGLGLQMRSQAEAMVRSTRGIRATTLPILA